MLKVGITALQETSITIDDQSIFSTRKHINKKNTHHCKIKKKSLLSKSIIKNTLINRVNPEEVTLL